METDYDEVKRAVAITRKKMLDLMEAILINTPHWGFIRKKIFQCLGNNGLDGMIDEIFGMEKTHREN